MDSVKALFGRDLKVEPGYEGYTAYTIRREFCGGVFEVGFVFQAKADKLISVTLATIGDCVVGHYMSDFGQPIDVQDSELGITPEVRSRWPAPDFLTRVLVLSAAGGS
jgi:hypothetical protein